MTPPADPPREAERVWFRFLRLETRIRLAITARLKAIGLSVAQCDVLTTLTEQEGLSQQDLATRLYVTKGNISGLVDRLAVAGLVERRPISGDKRSHALVLTPLGRETAERGIAAQRDFVEGSFGRLSPEQLGALEASLLALRGHVRARAAEDQAAAGAAEDQATPSLSTSVGNAARSTMT